MWYRLPLVANDGRRLHFAGFKVVSPGSIGGVDRRRHALRHPAP